jgi:hypothetical protein
VTARVSAKVRLGGRKPPVRTDAVVAALAIRGSQQRAVHVRGADALQLGDESIFIHVVLHQRLMGEDGNAPAGSVLGLDEHGRAKDVIGVVMGQHDPGDRLFRELAKLGQDRVGLGQRLSGVDDDDAVATLDEDDVGEAVADCAVDRLTDLVDLLGEDLRVFGKLGVD